MHVTCERCGTDFERAPSEVVIREHQYCSNGCRDAARAIPTDPAVLASRQCPRGHVGQYVIYDKGRKLRCNACRRRNDRLSAANRDAEVMRARERALAGQELAMDIHIRFTREERVDLERAAERSGLRVIHYIRHKALE